MIGREYAVLAGMVLYAAVVLLRRSTGRKTENPVLFMILFLYFTALVTITFFPLVYSRTGAPAYGYTSSLQLTPFKTISGMLRYLSNQSLVLQVVGNILLTIPYGILLPVMIKRKSPVIIIPLLLALPVVIETMQWVIGALLGTLYRTTDIDDVILNFAGGLIGYGIYLLTSLIWQSLSHRKNKISAKRS